MNRVTHSETNGWTIVDKAGMPMLPWTMNHGDCWYNLYLRLAEETESYRSFIPRMKKEGCRLVRAIQRLTTSIIPLLPGEPT